MGWLSIRKPVASRRLLLATAKTVRSQSKTSSDGSKLRRVKTHPGKRGLATVLGTAPSELSKMASIVIPRLGYTVTTATKQLAITAFEWFRLAVIIRGSYVAVCRAVSLTEGDTDVLLQAHCFGPSDIKSGSTAMLFMNGRMFKITFLRDVTRAPIDGTPFRDARVHLAANPSAIYSSPGRIEGRHKVFSLVTKPYDSVAVTLKTSPGQESALMRVPAMGSHSKQVDSGSPAVLVDRDGALLPAGHSCVHASSAYLQVLQSSAKPHGSMVEVASSSILTSMITTPSSATSSSTQVRASVENKSKLCTTSSSSTSRSVKNE
eukprot:5653166-Amphidinium_carterae.1